MLAPEFEFASGWTTTQAPKVSTGGRARDLTFGGETLLPGASFEIYGIAPTNVPYRYPVLWGLHPADALLRRKWKRVADEWCERIGIRPLDIWIFGGGSLFGSLLELGLVDAVEVAVIPVLLGGGVPLLPHPAKHARLMLVKHRVYEKTGTVALEYAPT